MNKRLFFLFLLYLAAVVSIAQSLPYKLYTGEGREVSIANMMTNIKKGDIIFFGELHHHAIGHDIELQIIKNLYDRHRDVWLAMEMFESDDQIVLDEYLSGVIQEQHLLTEAKVWEDYKSDYRPLIEFSKEKGIPVIASNIPRRYANLVYREGLSALDSLSEEAKSYFAPLPIQVNLDLAGYKELSSLDQHHHTGGNRKNLVYAQAVKDATMAYFIKKNKTAENTILHINGAYHSQHHEGIIAFLKGVDLNNIITIQLVEQDSLNMLNPENMHVADFVICATSSAGKTY